jgi:hypothetical protein
MPCLQLRERRNEGRILQYYEKQCKHSVFSWCWDNHRSIDMEFCRDRLNGVNYTKSARINQLFEFYLCVLPIQILALHKYIVYNIWLFICPEHPSFDSLFIQRMANIPKFRVGTTSLRSLLVYIPLAILVGATIGSVRRLATSTCR